MRERTAYYFAAPFLTSHGSNVVPRKLMCAVFEEVVPPDGRLGPTHRCTCYTEL